MSTLNLHLDEPETYSEHSKQIFSLLKDYLQQTTDSTLQLTATSLLNTLPKENSESSEVWQFFGICILLAEQIPYNHQLQLKLADLMEYVNLSPQLSAFPKVADSKEERSGPFNIHSRLPGSMRDSLTGPDEEFPGEYVNLSAFAAHLIERRVLGSDPTWAIVALHDAHEERSKAEGEFGQQERDELMLGAAQWILWYGQGLFKQVLYSGEVDPQQLKGSWSTGKLYSGEGGLSMQRWRFWKDGFAAVTVGAGDEKKGYGTECVEVAARAASIMETLEKTMTF